METKKVVESVMAGFERTTKLKIKRLREDVADAQRDAKRAREDIQEQKALVKMFRKLTAEIFKPPKPFKLPKTYIDGSGKRRRIPPPPAITVPGVARKAS